MDYSSAGINSVLKEIIMKTSPMLKSSVVVISVALGAHWAASRHTTTYYMMLYGLARYIDIRIGVFIRQQVYLVNIYLHLVGIAIKKWFSHLEWHYRDHSMTLNFSCF